MANYTTYVMNDITGQEFEYAVDSVKNIPAKEFSEEKYYIVGDYVMHDFKLYMCIDDEGFIPGPWDESQWEQHRIFDNELAIVTGREAPSDNLRDNEVLIAGSIYQANKIDNGILVLE